MGLIGLNQQTESLSPESVLDKNPNTLSGELVGLKTEVKLQQFQKEQEEIKKIQEEIKSLRDELNDLNLSLLKTEKFIDSETLIEENFTGNFDLNILKGKIGEYIYDVFSINIYEEKFKRLEELSGKAGNITGKEKGDEYFTDLRIKFRIQIPNISTNLAKSIISDLEENNKNLKEITKITIKKGIITIILENGKEVRSYKIDFSGDKKGFELKEPQTVNSDQRQEEKKEREEDLNKRHIYYPAIGLTFFFTLAVPLEIRYEKLKKNQLKEVEFTDQSGKNHKIRLEKEFTAVNEKEFIMNAISQIEKQTGYKLNIDKTTGKSFFESPDSQNINISTMVEMVEKTFNFEDFKKKLEAENTSGEKIDENELKKEFEKQKAESLAFLRGIELQEGPLINPGRFIRKLLVQSPKVMNLQHWILYPVFFKEMQKKPGNLESYFKSAGERGTFTLGAKLSMSVSQALLQTKLLKGVVDKSLKFLPGIPGTVARYLVETGISVVGGGIGVSSGEHLATFMKLQQKFDELFPESEDFVNKYLEKLTGTNKNSIDLNVFNPNGKYDEDFNVDLDKYLSTVSSLGNKEIADFLKLDLKVPIFGRIWQHDLDLNTDKQEYLSGSFRGKKFYNEMVDKMGDNIVDELEKLIKKYNDPVSQGFGGPVRLKGKDREILLEKRKITLLKNIEELIYSGDKETNKSIKDTVHNIITYNLDNVISGKTTILELKVLTQFELEKFKINDDFIEESEKELDVKKYMFEITFGIAKEPPDKTTNEKGLINYNKAFDNIAKNGDSYENNMFKYLQSLTQEEQDFAKNYFYRTLDRKEVIQTEKKKVNFGDAFSFYTLVFSDIGFFKTLGNAAIDSLKDDSKFAGEDSDEAIYERLIKNPLFHEYTLWVKEYKNNKEFIESMKIQK